MDVDPFLSEDETILSEFELTLSPEDIVLYEQCWENGYDVDLDPIYNEWRSLRKSVALKIDEDRSELDPPAGDTGPGLASSHQSAGNGSLQPAGNVGSVAASTRKISPAFEEVLKHHAAGGKRLESQHQELC